VWKGGWVLDFGFGFDVSKFVLMGGLLIDR
jgi:hypothetical protein